MTPPDAENRRGAPDRLHLHMRPPSPKTYERPSMSTAVFTFVVVVSVLSAIVIVLVLPLLAYALMAGDPG